MSEFFEQIELAVNTDSAKATSSADSFGCCSRYRGCSDAKQCLIPDMDYSKNCAYRKTLEAGKVFYGKNSEQFDKSIYDDYVKKYLALKDSEKDVLMSVLNYFFRVKVAAQSLVFCDRPEFDKFEKLGFIERVDDKSAIAQLIVRRCTKKALQDSCGNRITEAKEWAKSQRLQQEMLKQESPESKKVKNDIYREELISWILTNDKQAISVLCAGLRIITIPCRFKTSLQEVYFDFCKGNIISLTSVDADPRFLKRNNEVKSE